MNSIIGSKPEAMNETETKVVRANSYETRTDHMNTVTIICDDTLYVESHHNEETVYRTSKGWMDSPSQEIKNGISFNINDVLKIKRNNVSVFHMPYIRRGICIGVPFKAIMSKFD